ncbi:MAG TPA: ATP-binding protein [Mycobacterium sp.]
MARRTKTSTTSEPVTEDDVLADVCQPLNSNEPLIRFITGRVGTGKSHLVRWIRTSVPEHSDWHLVYIEKRNTSLRRIIEQVLNGIDTPAAANLRANLAQAASRITTLPEAKLALLNHLHRLIEFDEAPAIGNMKGADLIEVRQRVVRLIGDYTFKQQLSRAGGPIERIAKLAENGLDSNVDVNAEDLHISNADLRVDPEAFLDVGEDLQGRIRSFVSNNGLRTAAAALIDFYIPRATAEVFTGGPTDLLDVFEDVRGELAKRGQELFLFVEDLVLLHGIDAQLAQALTLPARKDLCPIRAVIAVTSGYLDDRYATFAERGVHYTMDVERSSVDNDDLRAFVGRYLNVGRVGRAELATALKSGSPTPNGCTKCPYRDRCHAAFGVTSQGHGLFPFNGAAVDHLVALASPAGFDPRNILREVIRGPLDVAEDELPKPGVFPSARFAAALAPTRIDVRVELRDAIARRSSTPDAEISLRAFYTQTPPSPDDELHRVADVLGVRLTDLADDDISDDIVQVAQKTLARPSEIDLWVSGKRLASAPKIRKWVLDALAARLQSAPTGFIVTRSGSEVRVGSVIIKTSSVVIRGETTGGGASLPNNLSIEFTCNDSDGVLLKGVLDAASGDLSGPNGGRWFFELQKRLATFEAMILGRAMRQAESEISDALAVLGVLSTVDNRAVETRADALAVLIRPKRPADINPGIVRFLSNTDRQRTDALTILRDRLTQRKGHGAPSVFDAGAVFGDLLPAARLKQLPDAESTAKSTADAGGINLRGFDDRQRTDAVALWAPIRGLLRQIGSYVSEGEDLLAAAEVMDRFVRQAHRASAFSSPDAKTQYEHLRARITPDAMRNLRRLTKCANTDPDPASLWHLTRDPTSTLGDMLSYWRLCDQLLRSLRDVSDDRNGDGETYDRARLQRALRTLADCLEGQRTR